MSSEGPEDRLLPLVTHKTKRKQADAATGVEEATQAGHLKVIEGWGLWVVQRWEYPRMNKGVLSLWTTHWDRGIEGKNPVLLGQEMLCSSAHGWFQTWADEAHSFLSGRSLEPGKEEGTPAGGGGRVDVDRVLS